MSQRLCSRCGVTPLGPRARVCDACLVKPTRAAASSTSAPSSDVVHPRDVVLACGHVVSTQAGVGEGALCPLHRQVRTVLRVHDGEEVPTVEPIRPPTDWRIRRAERPSCPRCGELADECACPARLRNPLGSMRVRP